MQMKVTQDFLSFQKNAILGDFKHPIKIGKVYVHSKLRLCVLIILLYPDNRNFGLLATKKNKFGKPKWKLRKTSRNPNNIARLKD